MDRVISIILHATGLGVLLSLSAFFSGSETALFSLNKVQVERLRQGTGRSGTVVARLLDTPRRLLITILVGNMFVNVACASLVASFATGFLGNKGVGLAAGITTILLLIFGEVSPKTVAVHNAEPVSKLVAYPIDLFSKLIFPLRIMLRFVTNSLMRFIGRGNIPIEDRLTTEELRVMVDVAEEEGSIKKQEKEMLNAIFDLRSITAAEIMVPRTEMVCISAESTLQQLFDLARAEGRSRIPVYGDGIDHISGIAYVRDFTMWRSHDILKMTIGHFLENRHKLWSRGRDTLVRQPFFVPETRTAMGLFQDFRYKGVQMAIVLDEYGGTDGLVTMEDLVEELVGEIAQEYDPSPEGFRMLDDFSTVVSGTTSIRNVNRKLKLALSTEQDIDTIGGYVLHLFGRMPKKGETSCSDGLEFEIAGVDRQRISQVVIRRIQGAGSEEDEEEWH